LLNQSYNGWLRHQSVQSRVTSRRTTEKLLEGLPVLLLALESATIMEPSQVLRINTAMNHLITEIRLLDISLEKV